MYKLTKEIIMGPERQQRLFLAGSGLWISNGEWAIHRDLIEEGSSLSSQDRLKLKFGKLADDTPPSYDADAAIERQMHEDPEAFDRTWLVVAPLKYGGTKNPSVVYQGSRGSLAFVAQPYADYFGHNLFGHPKRLVPSDLDNGSWRGMLTNTKDAPSVVLMPKLGPDKKIVDACRRALGLPEYEPEGGGL